MAIGSARRSFSPKTMTTRNSLCSASISTIRTSRATFARVIDFKTEYAQSLIDDFYQADKAPHIAVSVDMLDTGH